VRLLAGRGLELDHQFSAYPPAVFRLDVCALAHALADNATRSAPLFKGLTISPCTETIPPRVGVGMSCSWAGSFLLALFAGAGPGVPATGGMALASTHSAVTASVPAAAHTGKPTSSPNTSPSSSACPSTSPGLSTSPGPGTSPCPTPAPVGLSASPVLAQQSSRTWIATIGVNTSALCLTPSFELVTTTPDREIPAAELPPLSDCHGQTPVPGAPAVTAVTLTFSPSPVLTAPVAAAVVITPTQAAIAPVSVSLAVHRLVTSWQYVWIPLSCGLGLGLGVVLTMWLAGLPDPDTAPEEGQPRVPIRGRRFWNWPLYAAGAWTFGGSWATNITALGTVIATVLTATGTVSELLPGVELGRFSLLIAVAGGITVAAPLVFGALNYSFQRLDPTTLGVSVITLPDAQSSADIVVPAGATITLTGGVTIPAEHDPPAGAGGCELPGRAEATLISGATLAVPPGATVTVSIPPPFAGQDRAPAVAVPGATDIAVFAGRQLAVNSRLAIPASSLRLGGVSPKYDWTLRENCGITVSGGAKISFLGRAGLKLPAGATVSAPSAELERPARSSPGLRDQTVFRLPHTGQVIASQMWSLLAASFLTLFGTGAALGITGVLAAGLSSATVLVQTLCVVITLVAAGVVWVYSVVSIRALADPKPGDALNATSGTAFML
jgi:hypothetical protein